MSTGKIITLKRPELCNKSTTSNIAPELVLRALVLSADFDVEADIGLVDATYDRLAEFCDLTTPQARRAVAKLKAARLLGYERHSKYLSFTIVNFASLRERYHIVTKPDAPAGTVQIWQSESERAKELTYELAGALN